MTDTKACRERELAKYMIAAQATVRSTALHFGISKSTVHKDIAKKLPHSDYELYLQVRQVLDKNKQERHIRGGLATREKFRRAKSG